MSAPIASTGQHVRDWGPGTPPEALSEAVFGGALVVLRDLPPVAGLVARVRSILEDAFDDADPPAALARMAPDEVPRAGLRARKAVDADETANAHWRDTLAAVGYAPEDIYLDRVRLRVVPSRKGAHGRIVRPLPPHRDSWGSGIMAQINWWLPLYPLAPTRTMVVWPDLFDRPVANDSADWDYERLMARTDKDYPLLPSAAETPEDPGVPIVIEPGELLAFSAAHLHASVADDPSLVRLSLDTRTVWALDASAKRGAPNVDGASGRQRWEWFVRPI